ncbi:MAG: Unknown protein [uncultured Thiotrichaceae bacterium]|uniref:Spermidine synthase n=1 Tax=uncultured Thiotrichaceae bacterium TaxID=298394 RepID=A0A6S6T200_9GAMM|nr:MAG: Unknown protein [uncultured Thiotrichaceae bacterium]
MTSWQRQNLRNIQRNLTWLEKKPDGILMTDVNGTDSIVVIKEGTEIQLFFAEHKAGSEEITLSGAMSRIDIHQPLYLLGTYSQVMMLSLLFCPSPKHVYMMGFGGGRTPMLFHHHFPELHIAGSELDQRVLALNEMLFGLSPSERISVVAQDGVSHLTQTSQHYDIILLDCFTGAGDHPEAITTPEFYDLCLSKIQPHGVTVQYLAGSDREADLKIIQFQDSFPYVYYFADENTHVLFGLKTPSPPLHALIETANKIAADHQFSFPFIEHAQQLTII